MRHKEEWKTCDECQGQLESTAKELVVKDVRFGIVLKQADLCSFECACKWLDAQAFFKPIEGLENDVDNLTTDLWGGAGPDCCTQPVKAGIVSK